MLGALLNFYKFLNLETKSETAQNTPKQKSKSETSEFIELDEKENFFQQSSEIITHFENGKEIKKEIITQTIPVSKTTAIKKIIAKTLK